MPVPSLKKLAILACIASFSHLAAAAPVAADGQPAYPIIHGSDGYCDVPRPSFGESVCRKFRLHGIYAFRACRSRYVMLPYPPADLAPYMCPAPVARGYGSPIYPAPRPFSGYPVNYGFGPAAAYAAPATFYGR
ncbi:MAG TPA: hypothetical protein VKU82_07460 [Planctomycetaceae bacterium]|nr:hypothetical protein [Planctomycetaceae bacterium]